MVTAFTSPIALAILFGQQFSRQNIEIAGEFAALFANRTGMSARRASVALQNIAIGSGHK
jgi:hypothetical protein